jgi:hypothetical protein
MNLENHGKYNRPFEKKKKKKKKKTTTTTRRLVRNFAVLFTNKKLQGYFMTT